MSLRNDREDTRAQRERLDQAKADLAQALEDLAQESKIQAKAARSRWNTLNILDVYAAVRAVERAEQDVDIATHDLATARGEDA